MKGLYYHPDRIMDGSASVMMDNGKYSAVTLFLELIEELAPDVTQDLSTVYEIYAKADKWFQSHYKNESRLWPSEWNIVKQANNDQYPGYIQLKEAIDAWVHKFNLQSNSDFYQQVGLTSISFYYDDCKESERKKRLKEFKQLAKQYNVSLQTLRNSKRYDIQWPYEEKLVLSNNVMFSYEWMRTYYELMLQGYERRKKEELQKGEFEEYTIRSYSGLAWDPRSETWKEFEEQIDKAYAEYKELYRKRAENFLLERGYIKEREKRNLEHFKWLVHYQVQEWSLRQIADHYSNISEEIIHEDTVFRGIKSTAELVLVNLKQRKKL